MSKKRHDPPKREKDLKNAYLYDVTTVCFSSWRAHSAASSQILLLLSSEAYQSNFLGGTAQRPSVVVMAEARPPLKRHPSSF